MTDGSECRIERKLSGDTLWISVCSHYKGEKTGIRYKAFPVFISNDPIDPYIAYRLIEPGYESWTNMGIYQRELASFKESAIVTNSANNKGCVNCHTFSEGNPKKMLFHARGAGGGTVFVSNGKVSKTNLATAGPQKQGVYPSWHPDGRFVAFSSNSTHQCFTRNDSQPIEVYDTTSDIILLDTETGEITAPKVLCRESVWETFPGWSSDGKTLFFCAADAVDGMPENRSEVHYRLMAIDFDGEKFIGEPHSIFQSDSLSVSFPRCSGNNLMVTVSSYGTFPIWHREADLYMLDSTTGTLSEAEALNSDETESYHSWSSNGKWVIFSSRRTDGRYTRLFISHYEGDGRFTKPFLLPQKDPQENILRLKSYNIPEFITERAECLDKNVSKLF